MQTKLEKYVSQIERHLAELPAKEREEELQEIQSHLEMMIAENVARGYDSDNAVEKALEQFGSAEKIGLKLRLAPNSVSKRWRVLYVKMLAFNAMGLFALLIVWLLYSSGYVSPSALLLPWVFYGSAGMITFGAGWFNESIASKQMTALTFILWIFLACCIAVCGRILTLSAVQYLQPVFEAVAFVSGAFACRWFSKPRARSLILN